MTAIIVSFPVDRETRYIRYAAEQLRRRHGVQADRYWQTENRRLYARLRNSGLGDEAVRAEMQRFQTAVCSILERLEHGDRFGGDAA